MCLLFVFKPVGEASGGTLCVLARRRLSPRPHAGDDTPVFAKAARARLAGCAACTALLGLHLATEALVAIFKCTPLAQLCTVSQRLAWWKGLQHFLVPMILCQPATCCENEVRILFGTKHAPLCNPHS